MMAALTSLVVAVSVSAFAPQQAGSSPLAPELEARVQKLGKQLRCAVCQGLSIADSPASMARAQLDKVRELVAAGKSDEEIQSYFVERYGEWVLLQPRAAGINWLVWLGPALLIIGGFVVIILQIRKGKPSPSPLGEGQGEGKPPPVGTSDYLAQVRSELEQ
jgi:cytochrome c-type biogenesis protein CcmH